MGFNRSTQPDRRLGNLRHEGSAILYINCVSPFGFMNTPQVIQGNTTSSGSFTICLSDPETAENIVIDNYEQVSDAELERLGGWNYNHNPYTAE